MVYELKISKEDSTCNIYYDTIRNTLSDELGAFLEVPTFNKPSPLKRISVSLGFSCNFKCEYCLQSKAKKKKHSVEELERLSEKIDKQLDRPSKLEFWGGEPLLYKEEIRYLVDRFKDKVDKIQIITNGSLLDEAFARYLMANNVVIVLSHDCQEQKVRGRDVLEDDVFKILAKEYKDNFSINSVIHGTNIVTKDRLDYIESKLGTRDVIHGGEGLIYNSDFDYAEDVEEVIYQDLVFGEGDKYTTYIGAITSFINSLNNPNFKKPTTKCGIDKESYVVLDIDGKELTCHNYNEKLEVHPLESRKRCQSCILANLCKGMCPIIKEDSEQFDRNCKTMTIMNRAIFRASMFLITRGHLISIKDKYDI